jgi:predicted RNase H-like nuclease
MVCLLAIYISKGFEQPAQVVPFAVDPPGGLDQFRRVVEVAGHERYHLRDRELNLERRKIHGSNALVAGHLLILGRCSRARECDLAARRYLRPPRASSVFPAPVRSALVGGTYADACAAHLIADGRRMSKQAFAILPKIIEVDEILSRRPELQDRIREVHPELCFAVWNGGRAMQHKKSRPAGRAERELLIDAVWPAERERLRVGLRRFRCQPDDLNDAFAALWTARRIHEGAALVFPPTPAVDRVSLRMEMLA